MSEFLALGGGSALGMVLSALILFFTLERKLKNYVLEASGKAETTTEIRGPQPFIVKDHVRHATHQELEDAKKEWKERHDEFERRAAEFRKSTERKLTEIDRHVDGIPHRVIALLKDTKGLIP